MKSLFLPEAQNDTIYILIGGNPLLPLAIVTITLALICYTIGVFSERHSGVLKKWHTVIFWLGLVFDTIGTTVMGQIARANPTAGMGLHGITGLAAIILMLFHAVWATIVLRSHNTQRKEDFHKFSIVVWIIWLIPYILGMILGMSR